MQPFFKCNSFRQTCVKLQRGCIRANAMFSKRYKKVAIDTLHLMSFLKHLVQEQSKETMQPEGGFGMVVRPKGNIIDKVQGNIWRTYHKY